MATVTRSFARKSFATAIEDLYTVPTIDTVSIVTNIVIANTSPAAQTFNIDLDDVELFLGTPIAGSSTISIDLKQVLNGDDFPKKIRGFASSNLVKVHISGVEIA